MTRIHNGNQLIILSTHHHVHRVKVANLGNVVAEAVGPARGDFDDFWHEESCHIEVVDGHVAEDPSRNFDVLLWGRRWVTADDDQLFQIADFASLYPAVDRGKVWVKAAVEAERDLSLGGGHLFNQCVHSVDI